MEAIFFLMFAAVYYGVKLCVEANAKAEKAIELDKRQRNGYTFKQKSRVSGRYDFEFEKKFHSDSQFRESLFKECNHILGSIPELNGAQMPPLGSSRNKEKEYDKQRVLEMIYNAKSGNISSLFSSGYMMSFEFLLVFPQRPTSEGLIAFFRWYQDELRKNGYKEATIKPFYMNEFPVAFYFENCGYDVVSLLKSKFCMTDLYKSYK